MFSYYTNEELIRRVTSGLIDLQARDDQGQTVLHFAVSRGRIQLLEILLQKGADANAVDDQGMTPLLMAVTTFQAVGLVSVLLRHGADVCFRTDRGNALHYLTFNPYGVRHVDFDQLVRILVEKGVPLDDRTGEEELQPLHAAVALKKNALVKLFLDHGANINARTKKGNYPLYFAAECRNSGASKILLIRGADTNLRTPTGRTALHRACKRFDEDNVRLLLFAGADVLAEDLKGKTPFCLIRDHDPERPRFKLMIKALALKKASMQPSIELKDERNIRDYHDEMLWNYYQDCHASISKMKSTRITDPCTFFDLLAKSLDQITTYMRDPKFESNFGRYDLNEFGMYAEDVCGAYERAQHKYHYVVEREEALSDGVEHILPDHIVEKVIGYLWDWLEKPAIFDYIYSND